MVVIPGGIMVVVCGFDARCDSMPSNYHIASPSDASGQFYCDSHVFCFSVISFPPAFCLVNPCCKCLISFHS